MPRVRIAHLAALMLAAASCTAGPIDVAGRAPTTLRDSVVAHWPLDEGSGSIVIDRSGNGHDGTLVGGTRIVGQFGGAISFDGARHDEITVPSFPQTMADWSVAVWVRLPLGDFPLPYVTLLSTEHVSAAGVDGGWEMNVRLAPTETFYQFAYWRGPGPSDYVSNDCHCVDRRESWTHLVGVVDSKKQLVSFYRDGVSQTQASATQAIKLGSPTLFMGRWQSTERWLSGALDDIVIYDRPLTPEEVLELFTKPYPDLPAI